MKHLGFFFIILWGFQLLGQGSYKVLEKSGKRPSWINGVENNFIITFANGATSEEAKENCLNNIRTQIASAIAINVKSKMEIDIVQKNGVTDEKFKQSIVSQSANLPFLKGISLSKAKEYYWEKLKNKDGSIVYGYHIKYPFSNAALEQLIQEYNEYDAQITKSINEANDLLETSTDFGEISAKCIELNALQDNLIDDRKDKINAILNRVSQQGMLYKFEMVDFSDKYIIIRLSNSKGEALKNFTIENLKSNCLKFVSSIVKEGLIELTVESNLCKHTKDAYLSFEVPVYGGNKLRYKTSIDVNLNKVLITQNGGLVINKLNDLGNNEISAVVRLSLNSKYKYPFEIKTLRLIFPDNMVLTINDINKKIESEGVFKLDLPLDIKQNIDKISTKNKAFAMIDVEVEIYNINKKITEYVKFTNFKYTTDW
jgi:hypothetical protein